MNNKKTLIVSGFVVIAVGVLLLVMNHAFFKNALSAEAIITDIIKSKDDTVVFIDYTVDGKTLSSRLKYSSDMQLGDRLTVYYKPEEPAKIRLKRSYGNFFFLSLLIGLYLISSGVANLIAKHKMKEKHDYLKKYGICLPATITKVEKNTKVHVNGRNPLIVTCHCTTDDGTARAFFSHNVWCNQSRLSGKQSVNVYVSMKGYDNYFVDVEAII